MTERPADHRTFPVPVKPYDRHADCEVEVGPGGKSRCISPHCPSCGHRASRHGHEECESTTASKVAHIEALRAKVAALAAGEADAASAADSPTEPRKPRRDARGRFAGKGAQ